MRRRGRVLTALLCLSGSTMAFHCGGGESSRIVVPLSAGAGGGTALVAVGATSAELSVAVDGLSAEEFYTLRSGGLLLGSFATAADGSLRVALSSPDELSADPRGRVLELETSGGAPIASAMVSGPGEPEGSQVLESTFLAPIDPGSPGSARARFRMDDDGRRRFDVRLRGVEPGDYVVFVEGTQRGSIAAPAGTGVIDFDTQPNEPGSLPLDFDPRGLRVDVVRDGVVIFSGPLEAQLPGMNACSFDEVEERLVPAPVATGGKAKLRARTREDCDRDVRVQVESTVSGIFDLFVDGVLRGMIQTAFDPGEGVFVGEIEFDNDPDEPGEVLLDFEALGAGVEIRLGGVLHFSSDEFGAGGPAGPDFGPCIAEEITTPLSGAGGGNGESRFRTRDDCDRDFRVEIEDVAPGTYELLVGGVSRGVFEVAFDPQAGGVQGEIEFDTDPDDPDELPLDFDPRGLSVKVLSASGELALSSGGASDPGGLGCTPDELELPLLSTGASATANAKARLRVRDDCDRDFRVELQDVADGPYPLIVNGVVRGVINVALGEGELEFDTDPDEPGELLLGFDPRGALVEVADSAAVLLRRTLE